MAYFYSEKSARFFKYLFFFLFIWLFSGVLKASLSPAVNVPLESTGLLKKLELKNTEQLVSEHSLIFIEACSYKNEQSIEKQK